MQNLAKSFISFEDYFCTAASATWVPWIDNTTGFNSFQQCFPPLATPVTILEPVVLEPFVIDLGKVFIEPIKEKKKKFRRLLRPE